MRFIGGIIGVAIIGLSFFMVYRLISSYLPDNKRKPSAKEDDVTTVDNNKVNSENKDPKPNSSD